MEEPKPPDNRNINTGRGNYNERIGGDYVQGNAFKSIINIIIGRSDTTKLSESRNCDRQILLNRVSTEVESRINSSLHNRVYILLDTEQNPYNIQSPWEMEVKVNSQPKITLNNTQIIQIFDQLDIAGRLLILGQPGAGKTTMILKLAEELVKRAYSDSLYPVPVLFSLPTWRNNNQTIKDWLVDQLKEKYGVRKDIAKQWINNSEILPILDGLDELAAERQELCVQKINDFLHPGNWTNPLVICSRTEEYQRYQTLLQLNNSVELCPFTQEQVYQYLQKTGNSQLWDSISNDSDLNQLARTPLLLNIIVLCAQEISIEIWQQFKSSEERLSYLFDAYISRMLKRPYKDKQPKKESTRRWLGWLAHQLIEENTTEFLIEKMQPYWLKNKDQKLIYNLIVGVVMGGLTCGLFFGLIKGLINELIFGVIVGVIYGMIAGLAYGLIKHKFETVKIPKPSLKKSPNVLSLGLISSLFFGLIGVICVLIGWQSGYQISEMISELFFWLITPIVILIYPLIFFGLILIFLGLIFALFSKQMKRLNFEQMKMPNSQPIKELNSTGTKDEIKTVERLKFSWKKIRYIPVYLLIPNLIATLIGGLISWMILGQFYISISSLIYPLIFTLISGLIYGVSGIEIENKTFPNQGIKQSVINAIILFLVTCPFATTLFFIILPILQKNNLIIQRTVNFNGHLISSLTFGLLVGIFIGFVRSGTPAIKHLVLRIVLWANGYIPWNYANFLNYCTNRLFLQRVGGGYRFIHKLLQDHFAQLEFKRN
jgi:MFS family permease/GTPase SAR1 family protein/5S rRNA maturation endonuclease (ribonuclease M5)